MSRPDREQCLLTLNSMALAFHVGRLEGEQRPLDTEASCAFYGLKTECEYQDFTHVKSECEGIFSPQGDTVRWLDGADPWEELDGDIDRGIARARNGYGYRLYENLDRIFAVAEPEDRNRLERLVGGREAVKPLFNFSLTPNDDSVTDLLAAVDSGEFRSIASRYARGPFAGHPASRCRSNLCAARSFGEYVLALSRAWLRYVRAAKKARGNVIVSVGFALTPDTIDWLRGRFAEVRIDAERVPPSPIPPHEQSDEWMWSVPLGGYLNIGMALVTELPPLRRSARSRPA